MGASSDYGINVLCFWRCCHLYSRAVVVDGLELAAWHCPAVVAAVAVDFAATALVAAAVAFSTLVARIA
jgi:hypothetical protein